MTDEEHLSNYSNTEIYAQILLGILRYVPVKNINDEIKYHQELTKKLKFQNLSDSKLLRACIDLIEDTEYAINEVYTNGIITNEKTFGESYLRLYGVLNACYLQMGAVIDLIRLFNLKDQQKIKSDLKKSKIIEVRNKIASHTTNYYNDVDSKESNFFRLAQSSIGKWGNNLAIVGKDDFEKVDLIIIMKEFSKKIELILEEIVKKELYGRTFKKEHFEWLEFRYNYVNHQKTTTNIS